MTPAELATRLRAIAERKPEIGLVERNRTTLRQAAVLLDEIATRDEELRERLKSREVIQKAWADRPARKKTIPGLTWEDKFRNTIDAAFDALDSIFEEADDGS